MGKRVGSLKMKKEKKVRDLCEKKEKAIQDAMLVKEDYDPTRYGDWVLKDGKCSDF